MSFNCWGNHCFREMSFVEFYSQDHMINGKLTDQDGNASQNGSRQTQHCEGEVEV